MAFPASRMVAERGVLVNLVEYPAVPLEGPRFRMQAMATHTEEQGRQAAYIIATTIAQVRSGLN